MVMGMLPSQFFTSRRKTLPVWSKVLSPKEKYMLRVLSPKEFWEEVMKGCRVFESAVFAVNSHLAWLSCPDPVVGLDVEISGFNPFIPLDDKNSSIPCAILEYTLKNRTSETVNFQFSFHLSHLAQGAKSPGPDGSRNAVIAGNWRIFIQPGGTYQREIRQRRVRHCRERTHDKGHVVPWRLV